MRYSAIVLAVLVMTFGLAGTASAATTSNSATLTVPAGQTKSVFLPCPDNTKNVRAKGHTDRGSVTVKANSKSLPKGATLTVKNTTKMVATGTATVTCTS
jgi:hypothetical protein